MRFRVTKQHARAAALAIALIAPAGLAVPAAAQPWQSIPPNPKVSFEYTPPASQSLQGIYQQVQARQILEELQRFLAPLHLPHPLGLETLQCRQVNAFFSPSERKLKLCYELFQELVARAPEKMSSDGFISHEAAIVGTFVGVVLHESGHMMFDYMTVPVFGREEDAADQMANFIALQFNKEVARTIVKGFIYFWAQSEDPDKGAPMTSFSDEHGTASQRMYNALCLGYGGAPDIFQEFVDKGWLPKSRAIHCGDEYKQLQHAFLKTIMPFIDQDLLKKVQQTQWLTPEELK